MQRKSVLVSGSIKCSVLKAGLEVTPTLSPVRIRELIRIPVRIPIAIELPNRLLIRRHRINRQEHTQLRIHVPLLHVAQPGGRVTHMPGIPRSVRDLTTYHGAIGLVVIALDHVAVGIALGHNRAKSIRVDVRDRLLGDSRWRHAKANNQPQPSQAPNEPSFRIRLSILPKRVDTPPTVPPNLCILPIPERALKQGWVFIAQEWPAAVSRSGTLPGPKHLGSRWGEWVARLENPGLPAMGRHYRRTTRSAGNGRRNSKQKAPTKAGAFAETGAGNRNRTYDLRITNAPLYQLSYSGEAGNFTVALPLRSIRS